MQGSNNTAFYTTEDLIQDSCGRYFIGFQWELDDRELSEFLTDSILKKYSGFYDTAFYRTENLVQDSCWWYLIEFKWEVVNREIWEFPTDRIC